MSDLKKLRWRCRRGTLELDLMLTRYVEHGYPSASKTEQQSFLRLLELEDSELMNYLIGGQIPGDVALSSLVAAIRRLSPELS